MSETVPGVDSGSVRDKAEELGVNTTDEVTRVGGKTKQFRRYGELFEKILVNKENSKILFLGEESETRSSRWMTRLLEARVRSLADQVRKEPKKPKKPKNEEEPGETLYVRRAWSQTDLSHCHSEARAVDIGKAKFSIFTAPKQWAEASTLATYSEKETLFVVEVEQGKEALYKVGSDPSEKLEGYKAIKLGKPKTLWIKSDGSSAPQITLFSLTLAQEELRDLVYKAEKAGLLYRCLYWSNEHGSWLLHCSVPASTLRMLYSELSNEKPKKRGEVQEQNKEGDPVPPRTPWEELEQDLHDLGWKAWFNHTSDLGGLHRPLVILPGDEMLVPSVQIVPVEYSAGLTYGDVLLQTAWSRGLTPRPIYLAEADRAEGRIALRFIHVPVACMPVSATRPPTLETLEISALHYPGEKGFSTCDDKNPRGKPLWDILKDLTADSRPYSGITVVAHASLLPQYVGIKKEEALPVGATFVEIMDTIGMKLLADWDWYGEGRAFMVPKPGYGPCGA
jgi:hypothetical protein